MRLFILRLRAMLRPGRARSELSRDLYEAGERKHWYYIHEYYCPVCGRGEDVRIRVYGPRPFMWRDRRESEDAYDGCEGY